MTSKSRDIEAWANAYIQAQRDPNLLTEDHPLWWSVERFMLPESPEQAEDCWAAILAVLRQAPSAKVVAVLAAGPLEDLIECFGPQFIGRIEAEAKRCPAFRDLLGGVWKCGTPEVWARVEAVRGTPW